MTKQILSASRSLVSFVVILAVVQSLWAQNIRIGTVDQGASYTIGSGPTNQTMTFTSAGATATASTTCVWTGRIVMESAGTIAVTYSTTASVGTTLTVEAGIQGGGDLTKSGNGTLLLNSFSSQTGGTVITGGTFQAGKNKVFSSMSAFTLSSGTLDINNTEQEIASLSGGGTLAFGWDGTGSLTTGRDDSDTIFSGDVIGSGTLTKVGKGFMVLNGSAYSEVDLNMNAGTLVVNGDFGTAVSTATVADGAKLGGAGTLYDVNVNEGGVLAPGNRYGEAVTSTETLTINNNLTLDAGSTLSIRVDDAGNSDTVIVGGTLSNTDDANLEIYALAGEYDVQKTYQNFLVDSAGTNISNFKEANVSLYQKFLNLEDLTESPNTFWLSRTPNYFTDRAQNHNQREVARVFDQTTAPVLWWAMSNISNLTDQTEINRAYHELSGEVKANSMMLGQWRTSRYGLNHMDMTPYGMKPCCKLWLEAVHQTTDFSSDGNSRGYGISRTGFVLGSEERIDNCLYGMLIGYTQPFLYSQDAKYEASDLQVGFYGGTYLFDFLETKMFIGFGGQDYETRRFIKSEALTNDPNGKRIDGDYDGNSMSMSLEFAVPFNLGLVSLRPLFAIDSDLSWQYHFTEAGDSGYEMMYGRGFFDRTFVRVGLSGKIGSVQDESPFAVVGRLNYSYQAGGNPYPVARSQFVGDPSINMTAWGVDPGRNHFNIGVGFRWQLDSCRSFYGDYDYDGTDRSSGHYASIGFMQQW